MLGPCPTSARSRSPTACPRRCCRRPSRTPRPALADGARPWTVSTACRPGRGRRPVAAVPRRVGRARRPRSRRRSSATPTTASATTAASTRCAPTGGGGRATCAGREPTNQGFLRALAGLGAMATAIGEDDEADRIALFLAQLDPDGPPWAVSAGRGGSPAPCCAAAQSRRMGTDKAFVEVGGVAMAARVAAALDAAGCDPVVLVGGDGAALAPLGRPRRRRSTGRARGRPAACSPRSARRRRAVRRRGVVRPAAARRRDRRPARRRAARRTGALGAVVARTDRPQRSLTAWRRAVAADAIAARLGAGDAIAPRRCSTAGAERRRRGPVA